MRKIYEPISEVKEVKLPYRNVYIALQHCHCFLYIYGQVFFFSLCTGKSFLRNRLFKGLDAWPPSFCVSIYYSLFLVKTFGSLQMTWNN